MCNIRPATFKKQVQLAGDSLSGRFSGGKHHEREYIITQDD